MVVYSKLQAMGKLLKMRSSRYHKANEFSRFLFYPAGLGHIYDSTSRAECLDFKALHAAAVCWLEGQRLLIEVVLDVVVRLHDVADDGQRGRTLHHPADNAALHLHKVVRHRQIHVGSVEVQHHRRDSSGGVVSGDLVARPKSIRVSNPRE
ncbi:hypothetical protein EJB05_56291 [Eragrostis curvula]|uniref:Uncharacterized protein n=1 Tax=Eragrostis curvula TaxID=38414 RepID=A0A5J9SIS1_9POAL|nr:hypothetical protein EJB05_56291 [Eragrostis curvula]